MTDPILAVEEVRTVIRKRGESVAAVDGVSFEVAAGEVVAIVGETGSGKSLTALSVLRLLREPVRLESGTVSLRGRDLASMSPSAVRRVRTSQIGMVFQDPMTALNPFMTVHHQLAETIRLNSKLSKQAVTEKILKLLGDVGIVDPALRAEQYPHELSGGTQQRVMIAMALANEPTLLIADEPTTGLDATVQAQILQLIRQAAIDRQMGVLLITHDLGVVSGISDRTIVMYAGQIVESGRTEALLRTASHPYTRALLEATPRMDSGHRRLASIPGQPPNLFAFPTGCRFHPRCPLATDRCRQEAPALAVLGTDRRVRCWFPILEPNGDHRIVNEMAPSLKVVVDDSLPAGGLALQVRDVKRYFPIGRGRSASVTKAVDGVSFDLRFGETLGIVGESGCGKSTLAKLLANLDIATSGAIDRPAPVSPDELNAGRGADRAFVQYVFQDTFASLDPRRTILQTIEEPLRNMTRLGPSERTDRVRQYMAACGLSEALERRYPHELSGGQRQRVGICRALVIRPRVVVMDEPMSGLDVSVQAQIVNLLQDLKVEFGLTSVLVSHDIGVVRHLCDRVAVMYLGRIVEIGPTEEILSHPLHPYTAALLSSVPLPDPDLEAARSPILLQGDVGDVDRGSCCAFSARCPAATERCRTEPLQLRPSGRGLQVACHYPGALEGKTVDATDRVLAEAQDHSKQ
jgi:peptide/nickel transport system ATP-binding protein